MGTKTAEGAMCAMSAGQHRQANHHAKHSRGGRLLSKLGIQSRSLKLKRLEREMQAVAQLREEARLHLVRQEIQAMQRRMVR